MSLNEKLEIVKTFIGKKVSTYITQPNGGLQLQEYILKSAWLGKNMVLVDFQELKEYNYVCNVDTVGVMNNGRLFALCGDHDKEVK
jgi:hypothetical protein